MKRYSLSPRSNWQQTVEEVGLDFHTIEGQVYWDESACYEFSSEQIDQLEEATQQLEDMCLNAVDRLIEKGDLGRLGLSDTAQTLAEVSWRNQHKNLYGRFDFSYNGYHEPKLLEYNADTPTALFEASVVQWQWLEEVQKRADQFNSIHEKLIEAWRNFGLSNKTIYFSCVGNHAEDKGTVTYLADTAFQAGLRPEFIEIVDIGWDGRDFIDLESRPIQTLFKLYPWEWLVTEEFANNIRQSETLFIEPAWKMVLSNKALLTILWEFYPDHPNLLPAYFEEDKIVGKYVRKPFFSREGANIDIIDPRGRSQSTEGPYGKEGYIYQACQELPNFQGNYPVIGSWVIASEAAGIGIREDNSLVTKNTSRFIPHYFK